MLYIRFTCFELSFRGACHSARCVGFEFSCSAEEKAWKTRKSVHTGSLQDAIMLGTTMPGEVILQRRQKETMQRTHQLRRQRRQSSTVVVRITSTWQTIHQQHCPAHNGLTSSWGTMFGCHFVREFVSTYIHMYLVCTYIWRCRFVLPPLFGCMAHWARLGMYICTYIHT